MTAFQSRFFENTGAVTGVFVLVGLSVAAICLWIFFAVRRRRRTQKLERDSAVSASLAAAGFKRTDLDDDFSRHSRVPSADLEMGQRSTLGFGRSDNDDLFDPFAVYPAALQGVHGGPRNGGYLPAAPTSPTLPFMGMATYLDQGHLSDNEDSPRDRRISGTGRTSAASYEPLLAYARTQGASPSLENDTDNRPPTPPPRNPLRMLYGSQPGSPSLTATPDLTKSSPDVTPMDYDRASEYSAESADHDDRLIPGLMRRARAGSIGDSTNDLRDDEDYSRPVLAVRNITTLTDASSSAH
jgi:LPXTG-motif cell wall-anchored protein